MIKLKCISAPRSWSHVNNTVVLTILTFQHIQCLHLMYAEVAWVLVSSETQVQLQIIPDPHYLPDYLSVSYDYALSKYRISSNKRQVSNKRLPSHKRCATTALVRIVTIFY